MMFPSFTLRCTLPASGRQVTAGLSQGMMNSGGLSGFHAPGPPHARSRGRAPTHRLHASLAQAKLTGRAHSTRQPISSFSEAPLTMGEAERRRACPHQPHGRGSALDDEAFSLPLGRNVSLAPF